MAELSTVDLEKRGTELAHELNWHGLQILEVCMHSLTDANFHREASVIEKILAALDNNPDPEYALFSAPRPMEAQKSYFRHNQTGELLDFESPEMRELFRRLEGWTEITKAQWWDLYFNKI